MDISLNHLQLELARIDLMLQRELKRWQQAGESLNEAFRGLFVSDARAKALLARPFATSWGQLAALPPDEAHAFTLAEAELAGQIQSLLDTAQSQGQVTRLQYVAKAFDLDQFELDTLLVCLAPALDLRYELIYGYLQDDVTRKRPGVSLVLDLLAEPGPERLQRLSYFAPGASLFKYRLLELDNPAAAGAPPLLGQTLRLDETVLALLLGEYRPHPDLGAHASLIWPEVDEADRLLAAESWPELERVAAEVEQPVVIFYGPDRVAWQATARLLAASLERLLLTVDLEAVVKAGLAPLEALELALRDARLTGAIPCLTGWDACLADEVPPPELLARLCACDDLVLVAGEKSWQAGGIDRDRPMLWFEFSAPAYEQRLALWQHYLALLPGADAGLEELDIGAVTGQFVLTAGQIRDVTAAALDRAVQRGDRLTTEDLLAAARSQSNPRLASLARKIVPRYYWEDIILPADQLAILREIVATVRGRPLVLGQWGIGRKLASSQGITVLFAGPPGTGKTMAAEIIARQLGLDLYKIDLSTIVSKYIGETEKNLERIFAEAQSSNAILFFDEADAIFGKRSEVKDAHDRYANIEVSYLLQRMEAYDGVTILATNLRANLDEAFTRRLQFAVDFPFPEEEDRLRIWRTLFPPEVPVEPGLDFTLLARRFKLAGGNIRNIIVSAAYLAAADGGRITMAHLLHGTRRELQKMGRLINEADLLLN